MIRQWSLPNWMSSRLALRLLAVNAAVGLVFAVAVTALNMFIDYNTRVAALHSTLEQVLKNADPSIAYLSWLLDKDAIEAQVRTISVSMPDVVRVEFMEMDGMTTYRHGDFTDFSDDTFLMVSEVRYVSDPERDEYKVMGTLEIVATTANIFDAVLRSAITIFLVHGVKTFFVVMSILVIFNLMVVRHLRAISNYAGAMQPEKDVPPLALSKRRSKSPDEIDTLAESIDSMRKKMRNQIFQLSKARKTELLQSQAIASASSAILILGQKSDEYCIQYVNQAAAQFLGVQESNLIDRKVTDFVTRIHVGQVNVDLKEALNSHQFLNGVITYDAGKDTQLIGETSITPIKGDDQSVVGNIVIITDVTEQRNLENQLMRSSKLEAIGKLSGGVAHDFNNILAVIKGSVDLARHSVTDKVGREMLHEINQAANRGKDLCGHLLAFARKSPLKPVPFSVRKHLLNMEQILRMTLGEKITLKLEFHEGPLKCVSDPNQLENAILNLAINARDAMPGGGTFSLSATSLIERTPLAGMAAGAGAKKFICITAIDTGTGIPPDEIDRIFDPFFTTKPQGKGTGLGLSMVHGFAKQSNGKIFAYSALGEGTKIEIHLPSSDIPDISPPKIKGIGVSQKFDKTVLIVEDYPQLLNTIAAQVRSLGYRVVTAEDGPTALKAYEAHSKIDLLLTDIVLPNDLDGGQIAEALRKRDPDLKVIFMTGYSENELMQASNLDGKVAFLQKPFDRAELSAQLSQTWHEVVV